MPQWDLLDLLADAAAEEPTFTLRRNAEVTDLVRDGGRVAGCGSPTARRTVHELRADADRGLRRPRLGRARGGRAAAARVRRADGRVVVPAAAARRRPAGRVGRVAAAQFMVMIDRGDYWQCGYLIRKGSDATLRAEGIDGVPARG